MSYEFRQFYFDNELLLNTDLMKEVASPHCTPKTIRKLLKKDPSLLQKRNLKGDTALHFALKFGCRVENVVELLEHGALQEKKYFTATPMHVAAERACEHQYDFLNALLKYGADVNEKNYEDQTPLLTLLLHMKRSYQNNCIYLLLSHGAVAHCVDINYKSVLQTALKNHNVSIDAVRMLLKHGAKPKDCFSYTIQRDLKMTFLLLQYILIDKMNLAFGKVESPHDILDVTFYQRLSFFRELVQYRDNLFMELNSMKNYKLSGNYSLFSYVYDRCSTAEVNENDLEALYTSMALRKLNQYPHCKDLFEAAIKDKCILNAVHTMDIYARKNDSDCSTVHLNSDIIREITADFSRQDFINLFLAYNENQQPGQSESSIRQTKRLRSESNNSELSVKFPRIV